MQRITYPFWIFCANKRLFLLLLLQFMIFKNAFLPYFFRLNKGFMTNFINGWIGFMIRCIFINPLNIDCLTDFFFSVQVCFFILTKESKEKTRLYSAMWWKKTCVSNFRLHKILRLTDSSKHILIGKNQLT